MTPQEIFNLYPCTCSIFIFLIGLGVILILSIIAGIVDQAREEQGK